MKIRFIILSAVIFLGQSLCGQDLHFSQFFNSPLTTNPANTGFIPDADYRIGAHYRSQFNTIMALPYKTMSIYGDAQIFRDRFENGWMGLGGVLLRDEAGSGGLTSTKAYASIAYHQMLGYSSLLTAGFNIGWANKRIDQTKLKFPDQFDGSFFDNKLPTSVVLVNNNISYFDMQAGINYAYFPTELVYINAGYSIHHVNRPRETFFGDSKDSSTLKMRHIGFANAILKIADDVIINPNAYFTTQAKAMELSVGLNAAVNLSENGEKQLLAGLYFRVGDAVIPMVGLEINNVRFMISYDVTTSNLRHYNASRGASEFNLMKKGFYQSPQGNVRQTLCPSF